jgi:Cu+-exporting ATPase
MTKNLIEIKVDGMDCANCAAGITKFLQRKGLEDVYVNFQTKEVRFQLGESDYTIDKVKQGIHKLGYTVIEEDQPLDWWTLNRKLWISAIFTFPLLANHLLMMAGIAMPLMDNFWVQFLLCLPVFLIGFYHFGSSAFRSVRAGVPNMDVLIFIGSTAAFIYSLIGTLMWEANYIFYETSATIIMLVLLGNWLEHRAVQQTTNSIKDLAKLQVEEAKRIMPSGTIVKINKDEIRKGHLLQVNEGDKIPSDGVLIKGNASVDESMITGESIPVDKEENASLIGGSLVVSGNVQMKVTATGKDTVLEQMIELVKSAQENKPNIQRLADRISAIFVPVVLGIALLTLLIGHFAFGLSFQQALMNAIAVLVISCPCAMGLATPTAVMVGVGRMAQNGILVKGGQTVEIFSNVKNIVFDKTGTLTTGAFRIKNIDYFTEDSDKANNLIYAMEQRSSHPIAASLLREMESKVNGQLRSYQNLDITEQKGEGVLARDTAGNEYQLGSARILKDAAVEKNYQVYLTENGRLIAGIALEDEVRADAADTIHYLQRKGIKSIILSGDKKDKTADVSAMLGIDEYYAEQLPAEKLEKIEALSKQEKTAMVGDGINDAPALAKATVGVSLSNASQAAIQSAQIVLLNGNLEKLQKALSISQMTVLTIKQNLFWAFIYNIVAIPIAAVGLLNPMWGALFMAFSDIVVIGNSIRLNYKKIK